MVEEIKGRVFYFGPWADPDGAVSRYLDVRDDLQAGAHRGHAKTIG